MFDADGTERTVGNKMLHFTLSLGVDFSLEHCTLLYHATNESVNQSNQSVILFVVLQ